MQPAEFLALAQLLSGPDGPHPQGRHRSAVSRSYYYAFLEARQRLASVPHIAIPRKNAHDVVWKAMAWAAPPLKSAGRLLKDLKALRERADYDLDPDLGHADVLEAIRIANDIRRTLESADMSQCVDPNRGPTKP